MLFSTKRSKDINLLSKSEQSAQSTKSILVSTLICSLVIIFLVAVSVLVYLLAFSEERQSKQLSEQYEAKVAEWQRVAKPAEEIGLTKAKLAEFQQISSANQIFALGLEKIRSNVPSGVILSSLAIKTPDSLTLQASSASPLEAYQFVEQLKTEKDFFTQVVISSLVKNSDRYVLNLTLKLKTK